MPRREVVGGYLEVGKNTNGEVVLNHPDLKPDANGVGHIVFSPRQARNLAALLIKHAWECENPGKTLSSPTNNNHQPQRTDMPETKIFKVEAEGDTLYIQAADQVEAKTTLTAKIGEIPDSLLTWSEVTELPEGEEFL